METSISQINASIAAKLQNEPETGIRTYSKKTGFNAVSPLAASDTETLAEMACTVAYALATRAGEGDETAADALSLVAEYCSTAAETAAEINHAAKHTERMEAAVLPLYQTAELLDFVEYEGQSKYEVTREFIRQSNDRCNVEGLIEYLDAKIAEANAEEVSELLNSEAA